MGYSQAMGKHTSESERLAAVDAVLDAMESHVGRPDTLELHDPLYAWRQSDDEVDLASFRAACLTHAQHPVLPDVHKWLGAWLGGSNAAAVVPTLQTILNRHGHPVEVGSDPVEAVGQILDRYTEVEALLKERIQELEQAVAQRGRLADAMAGVGALAFVIALLGWLAAAEVLPVPWLPPPTPPEEVDDGTP